MIAKTKKSLSCELDLQDSEIIHQQRENIRVFSKRWLCLVISFFGFFLNALVIDQFVSEKQMIWGIFYVFVWGIFALVFAFKYKCPHCGTMPTGEIYGLTTNSVSYSKGFTFFPKRCSCCGFYLASRALKADLRKCTVVSNDNSQNKNL